MFKKISAHVREHEWFAVGIEVLVVIIGLMLAFQLDRWREGIGERQQERDYVLRLISDVEADIPALEYAIDLQFLRLGLVDLLMAVAADPAKATEKPAVFLGSVNQAAYTYTPVLASETFENLRSTGDLRLILDESVKRSIFEYYGFDQSQHQFRPLQIQTEFRHFELVAGVLDHDQEVFVQDHWRIITPKNIEAVTASQAEFSNVLAAARRLQAREEFVAWLPYVRHMQMEQINVHGTRLEHARATLEKLKDYAREIGATHRPS